MAFIFNPKEEQTAETTEPMLGGGSSVSSADDTGMPTASPNNRVAQSTTGAAYTPMKTPMPTASPVASTPAAAEPWNVQVPNYTPAAPIQKTPEVQARDDMFLQNVRQQSDQANKVRQDAIDFTNNNQAAVQANNNNFLQSVRTETDRLNAQRQAAIDYTANNQQAVADRDAAFLQSVRDESARANAVRQKSIDDYYAANPEQMKYKLANEALYGKDVW